jgi:hypothetical protein
VNFATLHPGAVAVQTLALTVSFGAKMNAVSTLPPIEVPGIGLVTPLAGAPWRMRLFASTVVLAGWVIRRNIDAAVPKLEYALGVRYATLGYVGEPDRADVVSVVVYTSTAPSAPGDARNVRKANWELDGEAGESVISCRCCFGAFVVRANPVWRTV